MSRDEEIRKAVLESLLEVAPDVDAGAIDPARSFHEQLDIDSVDFLNFVLTLEKKLGVHVPESDYPRLSTVDGAVAFLETRQGAGVET